jgi:hypothetical protein
VDSNIKIASVCMANPMQEKTDFSQIDILEGNFLNVNGSKRQLRQKNRGCFSLYLDQKR